MSGRWNILVAAKLQTAQLERHLEPLTRVDRVNRIFLVRHQGLEHPLPKIDLQLFQQHSVALDAFSMFRRIDELLRRETVHCVIGLNPVPWGSVGWVAASRHGVPVVMSLIGTDIQRLQHQPLAKPFWIPVRRAAMTTVTGASMARQVEAGGVDRRRIGILPHVIDMERFAPAGRIPEYDAVFVGQLIPVKQVDLILDAVSLLRKNGRTVRIAIAGSGPLDSELRARSLFLDLGDSVTFLGFRADIQTVLQSARIFVMASRSEGMPFALIEAMACGLVPVVPDVGTISDLIVDGRNGRLLGNCNARTLADALASVLDDAEAWRRMRDAALEVRQSHAMTVGSQFWANALARVARAP